MRLKLDKRQREWLSEHGWWFPFVAFAALVLCLAPRHEPWFDEAQAWLLARDLSPWDLVGTYARYEGHPTLWHLFLRMLAANGLPYWTMNFLSALFGIGAAYLLLRYSPFPPLLRALLPFTYFLFYQYTIVARSYVLLAPVLFLIAFIYRERQKRPVAYTALLLLLANTSLHGALIAASLFGLLAWEVGRGWRRVRSRQREQLGIAAGMAAVGAFLLALQLWKPADVLAPPFVFGWEKFAMTLLNMTNSFLTENFFLSLVALATSLWWFYERKTLALFLVPSIILLVFFALLYGKPWHEGILFLVWLLALWVSFEGPVKKKHFPAYRAVLAGSFCVVAVHLYWSFHVYRADYRWAYSGAKAAAEFIQSNKIDRRVVFGTSFQVPAISPYFKKNILANYNDGKLPAFWWWSTYYKFDDSRETIVKRRPEFLLVAIKFPEDFQMKPYPGYSPHAVFPGRIFWKDRFYEYDSYVLLRRDDVALPERATAARESR